MKFQIKILIFPKVLFKFRWKNTLHFPSALQSLMHRSVALIVKPENKNTLPRRVSEWNWNLACRVLQELSQVWQNITDFIVFI